MMNLINSIPFGLGKVLVLLAACLMGLLTLDYVRPKLSLVFALSALLFLFVGCAALPMPFQPVSQENSNYAVSLGAETSAVLNTYNHGCKL